MGKHTIEIFMPLPAVDNLHEALDKYVYNKEVVGVWLWSASETAIQLPEKTKVVEAGSLLATSLFRDMAGRATADFVVCMTKEGVSVDDFLLDRLLHDMPDDASMAYADYRKVLDGEVFDAPTIDYQSGSLRNDFDFGSLLVFRTSALKEYLA